MIGSKGVTGHEVMISDSDVPFRATSTEKAAPSRSNTVIPVPDSTLSLPLGLVSRIFFFLKKKHLSFFVDFFSKLH